jgi:hypothetical protein
MDLTGIFTLIEFGCYLPLIVIGLVGLIYLSLALKA